MKMFVISKQIVDYYGDQFYYLIPHAGECDGCGDTHNKHT